MDWESPYVLLLAIPALLLLIWIESKSAHPMSSGRKRALLVVRALLVILGLLALAGPARVVQSGKRSLVMLLDVSQSLGDEGTQRVLDRAKEIRKALPKDVTCSMVAFGNEPKILPEDAPPALTAVGDDWRKKHDRDSNYGQAVEFAGALFPAGSSRHIVMLGDGHETRGSLLDAAKDASAAGIRLHAVAVSGPKRSDVRVRELAPNRSRLHEGASLRLKVVIESTVDGAGVVKLFENGIEVDSRPVSVKSGQLHEETFTRTPSVRNIYKYRAVVEGFPGDSISANNDALTIVDVRGRLRLLYLEGNPAEGQYLMQAMEKEGVQLDLRQAGSIPSTLEEMAGYDGIIISDIPAFQVGDGAMTAMRDYVDKLGGGLIMLGGSSSFGVGGYYRTPIEDVLPVRLKSPDDEEKQSSALAIIIDRSGSMAGEKLEMAKSAAIATAEVLSRNDFLGVFAFDSEAHVVAPMSRITSVAAVAAQISAVAPGGGTNLQPAFLQARESLQKVKAKVKHMIILTDGQTAGSGYETLAGQCRNEGITISTVSIGQGSHVGLLQAIATAGGGQAYTTTDASSITRIFTQDTLMHTGRMIREEPFTPAMVERHPLLAGWDKWDSPALLGYVKTLRKSTAQIPLVTDLGDPLLAHWRFGLGKVTAFTSDAKSRWASLWISRWDGFGRFWSQVLRETARPPQGQHMDLICEMRAEDAHLTVDLLEDAGSRQNNARVDAEVFFVAADALGAPLKPVSKLALSQSGPGLYEGSFRPDEPGVYLVRAQSGAEMVSAGIVHNPSSEASLGTVNEPLLKQVTQITGGTMMTRSDLPELASVKASEYFELWPPLLVLLLLLFLVDVAIRRWEHVVGIWESIRPERKVISNS